MARSLLLLTALATRLASADDVKRASSAACPVCGAAMSLNPRYPRAVCTACVRRACDANGRTLDFFNVDAGGGYLAVYREGGEIYDSHACFIDGHRCHADEAKLGGIVVQVTEDNRQGGRPS